MSEEKRYCRTCKWSRRNTAGSVDLCVRKVVEDRVEGPRIVLLNPRRERSILGGCGVNGHYWEPCSPDGTRVGMLDERLIP